MQDLEKVKMNGLGPCLEGAPSLLGREMDSSGHEILGCRLPSSCHISQLHLQTQTSGDFVSTHSYFLSNVLSTHKFLEDSQEKDTPFTLGLLVFLKSAEILLSEYNYFNMTGQYLYWILHRIHESMDFLKKKKMPLSPLILLFWTDTWRLEP